MASLTFPSPTQLKNLANPSIASDAATKDYVDSQLAGGGVAAAGSNTEIQFNNGSYFGSSANLTFDSAVNLFSVVGNVSVSSNITRDSKTVPTYVASASTPANAKSGDHWYDTSNNVIYQYVYDGSTSVWIDISTGYISSNTSAVANTIALRDANANIYANYFVGSSFVSDTSNIAVTTNTVVDSFNPSLYRTAKYIIKAGSDDGFQSLEVLLVHDDSDSYITVYGVISSIIDDIVTISSNISGGNVNLYASTVYANTTVTLIGTYLKD